MVVKYSENMKYNFLNFIKNHIVECCIAIALLLCMWAIGSIRLKLIPLISTCFSQEVCDGWNEMYVNLSYSFIAGFIFFLLTTILKDYFEKKKMKEVLKAEINQIASPIESILDVFYGVPGGEIDKSRNGISNVLNARNFNDKIGLAQSLGHKIDSTGTYINYLATECNVSKNRVYEMIKLFGRYLSIDEIVLLESYASMRIISVSYVASSLKCIDPEKPELKAALIGQFCDLYDKLNELRKVFQ